MNTRDLTIKKLQDGYVNKEFSVAEVVAAYQKNITEKNDEIFAYLEVFEDIDEQVRRAQQMIDDGNAQPMTGVPIAIKDNILITGRRASGGSKILEPYTATYDADVIQNLRDQGAVFLGRTNMDEFAMGSSTETSAFGATKNPVNPEYVPGGSSGGSAAAVAMDGALVSLGSDTGGSIRQPAAFCGLVGLKPTYGSVSRSGLMAMASSLDVIGPFGKTVADVETVFKATARHDAMDSTSINSEARETALVVDTEKPLRIGVPRDFLKSDGIDAEVLENFEQSLDQLRAAGHEIVDIEMPFAEYALAVYYILMPAEVSTNVSRYDGVRYGLSVKGSDIDDSYTKTRAAGFGPEVKRRILLGTYVLSHGYYDAYYNKAVNLRKKIEMDFDDIFQKVDVVATPTTPTTAFKFGEKSTDPLEMYMSDIFTVTANIAGIPAMSVPSGVDKAGLPFGFHMMAPYLGEEVLFKLGKDFESKR